MITNLLQHRQLHRHRHHRIQRLIQRGLLPATTFTTRHTLPDSRHLININRVDLLGRFDHFGDDFGHGFEFGLFEFHGDEFGGAAVFGFDSGAVGFGSGDAGRFLGFGLLDGGGGSVACDGAFVFGGDALARRGGAGLGFGGDL